MKILILISGKRCSGKSYLANKLYSKYGFIHYEMSAIAKELRQKEKMDYLHLRKFVSNEHIIKGKAFLMNSLLNELTASKHEKIVVSGIRHIEEVNCIPIKEYHFEWFYIYDSLISRLIKTIQRPVRTSILEFFIEEYYSIKWKDYLLRKKAILIDKRKGIKALNQLEKILNEKSIISTAANKR